jgi:hypothetical protein
MKPSLDYKDITDFIIREVNGGVNPKTTPALIEYQGAGFKKDL